MLVLTTESGGGRSILFCREKDPVKEMWDGAMIGLDAAVNKKSAASNEIHRHVRGGRVISVTALKGIKAEVIELQAAEKSKIVKKPIHKISFPSGCVVGGIARNGAIEIATGQSHIRAGDRVIIFCLPDAIPKITSLFK